MQNGWEGIILQQPFLSALWLEVRAGIRRALSVIGF